MCGVSSFKPPRFSLVRQVGQARVPPVPHGGADCCVEPGESQTHARFLVSASSIAWHAVYVSDICLAAVAIRMPAATYDNADILRTASG